MATTTRGALRCLNGLIVELEGHLQMATKHFEYHANPSKKRISLGEIISDLEAQVGSYCSAPTAAVDVPPLAPVASAKSDDSISAEEQFAFMK
jgi:hypothetical protein